MHDLTAPLGSCRPCLGRASVQSLFLLPWERGLGKVSHTEMLAGEAWWDQKAKLESHLEVGEVELSSLSLSLDRASLWSSCVVLPLLALTWMSAVLAITDRRSALFQILFAVFDSLEGFVIVMVHCILRREVRGTSHCLLYNQHSFPLKSPGKVSSQPGNFSNPTNFAFGAMMSTKMTVTFSVKGKEG